MLERNNSGGLAYQGPLSDDDSLTFGSYSTGMENINLWYSSDEPSNHVSSTAAREPSPPMHSSKKSQFFRIVTGIIDNIDNAPKKFKIAIVVFFILFWIIYILIK